MATSIIKYDGDTTWTSGTQTHNAPVKYRLRNGICTVTANYSGEFTMDSTERPIITLPSNCLPTVPVYFSITNRATVTGAGYGQIYTDGKLTIKGTTTTAYFCFCVTYPVK